MSESDQDAMDLDDHGGVDYDNDYELDDDFNDLDAPADDGGVSQDDGEADYGFDLSRSQEISRTKSYEVLSEAKLQAQSEQAIDEVVDTLNLPAATAKTAGSLLLRYYKWNKEKLITDMLSGNADAIRQAAGITSPNYELELPVPAKEANADYECPICMETVKMRDTYALGCGHRYCKGCWRTYLELKTGEADCIHTHCPWPKCNEAVHELAFHALMGEAARKIYDRFAFRSLVDDNAFIKFCPAPDCSNAIRVERKNRREAVSCSCGFAFCFRCNDYEIGDHTPATCENVEAWLQKAGDESENVKWLIANTKKCPECRKPIEKNGGCMHMTCHKSSGGCGYEFCWLCRGPWSQHGSETGGYYACNKYDSSKAKEEDTTASTVKTELEEYMFYYHRYESHHNAMKIADEQRRQAELRASDIMDRFKVRAQDTTFLSEATEQLLANRKVLKWSYVYGYYLKKSQTKERQLFEYLQEDLEKHTDKLSQNYELPLNKIEDYHSFIKWKESVTNYTRVTAGFLKKFVEGVISGLSDV